MNDDAMRLAALNPERSFCVTAPAGSGKTELLTQRVLALIPRVKKPEQILAITFTRKAAAEMRDRVMQALAAAQSGEPAVAEHERRTRALAIAALAHAEAHNWSLSADAFNIRTIDGLCGYLTRRMPVLSGTGGALDMVDNAEPYYEAAVGELMGSVGAGNATGEALDALLINFDNNWAVLREVLVALLRRRGDWANVLGHHYDQQSAEDALNHVVIDLVEGVLHSASDAMRPWFDELEPLLQGAAMRLEDGAAAGTLGRNPLLPPQMPLSFPSDSSALENWRWLVNMLLVKDRSEVSLRKRLDKNCGFPAEVKAEKSALMAILESMRQETQLLRHLDELRRLPVVTAHDSSWQLVLHLSHLLPILAAHLLLVFRQHGQVDHTHVALAAEEALGDEESPTDLALRLDYQLEHILVDEFQDTSAPQFRLLEKLTRGWAEHNALGAAQRTLFIVGDGMQSIYRFRDANVGLFLQARRQGIAGVLLDDVALTRNFRSQAGIVDWVNQAFAELLPKQDDIARGLVRHSKAEAIHEVLPGDAVQTHLFSRQSAGAEAAFITHQIQTIRSEEPTASIAILGRTRRHLNTVIEALRHEHVAFMGHDLEPLSQSPAVVDLLSLCRWLANPADSIAAVALMRSPAVGLTIDAIHTLLADHRAPFVLIERLISADTLLTEALASRAKHLATALAWGWARRDRLSLPVWIEQVWLRLGANLTLRSSEFGDAQRFFDLLRQAEATGRGLDVDWLQREVEALYAEHPAEEHAVELLTLHKSKGLQFDYVFVVGLASKTRSSKTALLEWHFHQSRQANLVGQGLLIAANDKSDSNAATLFNYLTWLNKAGQEAELRRLLYVAITRAKRRVWLTAALDVDEESGDLKSPSAGSLLGILYEQVVDQAITHLEVSQSIAVPGITPLPLMRLKHIPNHHQGAFDHAHEDALVATSFGTALSSDSNLRERAMGIALHRGLELLANLTDLPSKCPNWLRETLAVSLRAQGLTTTHLKDCLVVVISMIDATLSDERGCWLLSNHTDAASELALVYNEDSSQTPRELVVDRTFIDQETGARWIIDYKTSRPNPGQSLAEFLTEQTARYTPQLRLYQDAIGQLTAASSPVQCALYFPALPHLHCLDFSLGSDEHMPQ